MIDRSVHGKILAYILNFFEDSYLYSKEKTWQLLPNTDGALSSVCVIFKSLFVTFQSAGFIRFFLDFWHLLPFYWRIFANIKLMQHRKAS
jgi:hypothetical protein